MIATWEDLIEHADRVTRRRKEIYPEGAPDIDTSVTEGGLATDAVQHFSAKLPDLPHSYVELVTSYDLSRFNLRNVKAVPSPVPGNTLHERVIRANMDYPKEMRPFVDIRKRHYFFVASLYSDFIFVAGRSCKGSRPGEVVAWSPEFSPQSAELNNVAGSFEDYLLIGANWDEIERDVEGVEADKADEFVRRVMSMGYGDDVLSYWMPIAGYSD